MQGLFPVSFLFSKTLKFPAENNEILKQYQSFPVLSANGSQISGLNTRRVHLELSLGSFKEVSVAVLNITGPLSGWSFADETLPADGCPPSYICKLSGCSDENWTFWLEADNSEKLQIDVAVIDQHLTDATVKLKGLFPEWADVTVYSSFMSIYTFQFHSIDTARTFELGRVGTLLELFSDEPQGLCESLSCACLVNASC